MTNFIRFGRKVFYLNNFLIKGQFGKIYKVRDVYDNNYLYYSGARTMLIE